MHPLPAFVMRYQHRSVLGSVGINQRFHSISYRVEGMENIEKSRTGREKKFFSEGFDAPDGYEHANRAAEGEEGTWVKIELRIMYEGLSCPCRTHYITNPLAKTPLQDRRRHWLNGSEFIFLQQQQAFPCLSVLIEITARNITELFVNDKIERSVKPVLYKYPKLKSKIYKVETFKNTLISSEQYCYSALPASCA